MEYYSGNQAVVYDLSEMDKIKIFKRLKNGKGIQTSYKKSEDIVYTIQLDYKRGEFILHSYYFDGNDVFDESNYKDESLTTYFEFDNFIKTIEVNFPGIEIIF